MHWWWAGHRGCYGSYQDDACKPGVKTGEMLNQYIHDELMLECELEKIDLGDVLTEISIMESKAV